MQRRLYAPRRSAPGLRCNDDLHVAPQAVEKPDQPLLGIALEVSVKQRRNLGRAQPEHLRRCCLRQPPCADGPCNLRHDARLGEHRFGILEPEILVDVAATPTRSPAGSPISSSVPLPSLRLLLLLHLLGDLEPNANQFHVRLRRLCTSSRLLLETVKDVDRALEPDCVYGSIRVALVVLDHFQHPAMISAPMMIATLRAALLVRKKRPEHCNA